MSCGTLFDKCNRPFLHEQNCQSATIRKFPGGYFQKKKYIFDELEEIGVSSTRHDRIFLWFIVFDMESILQHTDGEACER